MAGIAVPDEPAPVPLPLVPSVAMPFPEVPAAEVVPMPEVEPVVPDVAPMPLELEPMPLVELEVDVVPWASEN